MDGMSLSDIAAVTRDNDLGNGNSGILWILVLIVLLGGGNFGNWGNRNGNPVTEAALCNSNNFVELQNSVGRLNDQNQQQTMTLNDAVLTSAYQTQSAINGIGTNVALAQANLQQQSLQNMAELQKSIDGINFNLAQGFAAANAANIEMNNRIINTMKDDKIETLQARVNQLENQNQINGIERQLDTVVRFPTATTYGAGWNPFFNPTACNCGGTF